MGKTCTEEVKSISCNWSNKFVDSESHEHVIQFQCLAVWIFKRKMIFLVLIQLRLKYLWLQNQDIEKINLFRSETPFANLKVFRESPSMKWLFIDVRPSGCEEMTHTARHAMLCFALLHYAMLLCIVRIVCITKRNRFFLVSH